MSLVRICVESFEVADDFTDHICLELGERVRVIVGYYFVGIFLTSSRMCGFRRSRPGIPI
jgi:hypothetical protein